MKKCPYCGMQNEDDSLFCSECGKKMPHGRVCPHCGSGISDDDAFCANCGKKVEEQLSSDNPVPSQRRCPSCGTALDKDDVFCPSCGKKLGEIAPSSIKSDVEDKPNEIHDKDSKKDLKPNPLKTVEEPVTRNEISEENVIDHQTTPPVTNSVEDRHPSKSKTGILIVIGIIALVLIGGWFFWRTNNSSGSNELISADGISMTKDSVIVEEDISDVHSKTYIMHRLQQVCDNVPSSHKKNLVKKYFSESFRELFGKVCEKDGDDGDGYFGFYFWSGSDFQDESIISVTAIDVNNITEFSASAKVENLVKWGDNEELKKSLHLNLVFENGDWFIDDLHNHKSEMEEYINREDRSQDEIQENNDEVPVFTVPNIPKDEEDEVDNRNGVVENVDQKAGYPGGTSALYQFLARHIRYPAKAEENGIQGTVVIHVMVERDGSISDTKVIRSVDPLLDKEALRVIQLVPNMTPAKKNGVVVRSGMEIPITFRLSD